MSTGHCGAHYQGVVVATGVGEDHKSGLLRSMVGCGQTGY